MPGFKCIIKKTLYTAGMCICILFFSCAGIPVSSSSGSGKVITNFMPSGNLQYYIRPAKMLPPDSKTEKNSVLIDFTYQKQNRDYVTDAYVKFTLNCKTDAFITEACFKTEDGMKIPLSAPSLLFRDTKKNTMRVTTVLEASRINEVLEKLQSSQALLEIMLDDGYIQLFLPTKDLTKSIAEAFSK